MNTKLKDCVSYFKSETGFNRVFQEIKRKYNSYGKLSGKITIKQPSIEEINALSSFFGKLMDEQKITFSIEQFDHALQQTIYEGIQLIDLLEAYYSKRLTYKKLSYQNKEVSKKAYFKTIMDKYPDTLATNWLADVLEAKKPPYQALIKKYNKNPKSLEKELEICIKAINQLPSKTMRLPVFSAHLTGNPHYFDEDKNPINLFTYALCYLYNRPYPTNAEQKQDLLYQAGLIKDDLSNNVIVKGLNAYINQSIHLGWQGFYNSGEPLTVTLVNLYDITRITTASQSIYIVENPAVFSLLAHQTKRHIPIICTKGQINLASYILLDKLSKEDIQMHYSGDFDPEGLLIADKLKQRYKQKLKLWHYTIEDYISSKPQKTISQTSLKKLQNLINPDLKQLANELIKTKKAGYQEIIIDKLYRDVIQSCE